MATLARTPSRPLESVPRGRIIPLLPAVTLVVLMLASPFWPASAQTRSMPGGLLWEDRTDVSPFAQAFSVATSRGLVFAAGFEAAPAGPRDFVVRAYHAATGQLAWQDRVDRGRTDFASGVATDNKRVFVSGVTFNPSTNFDWLLRAYDADTGTLLWENIFDLVGRSDFSRGTALAVGDGLVFLGGYGTTTQGGDLDYVVRAYDAETGALVWQDRILEGFSIAYSIAYDAGRLFVGGSKDTDEFEFALVRAYDAPSGAVLWEQLTPGVLGLGQTWTISVTAHGDRIFAGQIRRAPLTSRLSPVVKAFDAASGSMLWQDDFDTRGDRAWLNQVYAFGAHVFAAGYGGPDCTASNANCDAIVRAYDVTDGSRDWDRDLELSGANDEAALLVAAQGTLFVHSQANATTGLAGCCTVGQWVVHAFSTSTGQLLWQKLGGNLESGVYNMVVDGARLFIPGRAVDEATGDWDFLVRAYDVRGRSSDIEQLVVAPRELRLAGTAGTVTYDITFSGTVTSSVRGLVPSADQPGHVLDGDFTSHVIVVPLGTRTLRVSLFDDATDGQHDLDLILLDPTGALVGSSGGFTANETVVVPDPEPGVYTAIVDGFATEGPDANYTLFSWSLGDVAEGNLQVSGPVPGTGPSGTITAAWSGLAAGPRYFGMIGYSDGTEEVARTRVLVVP